MKRTNKMQTDRQTGTCVRQSDTQYSDSRELSGRDSMNPPLLSVVIPVYNVEKYFRECLDSVVNQTYKNLEIIIVNDCSPDNSEAIILEYAERDERIVYIKHDVNKGTYLARQSGTENCRGEYVLYIDPDDYIMPELCSKLAELIPQNPDCIVYDIKQRSYVETHAMEMNKLHQKFHGDEYFNAVLNLKIHFGYLVSKVYKKEILIRIYKDLHITQRLTNAEDVLINVCASYYCKKVLHLDYAGYVYNCIVAESATKGVCTEERCLYYIKQMKIVIDNIRNFLTLHSVDIHSAFKVEKKLLQDCLNKQQGEHNNRQKIIHKQMQDVFGFEVVYSLMLDLFYKTNNNEYSALKDMGLTRRVKRLAKIEVKRILKRLGLFELVKRVLGRS